MKNGLIAVSALALAVTGATPAMADEHDGKDFGQFRDHLLEAHSRQLFGVVSPVAASSTESVDQATAEADPRTLVTLARGLRARVVSAAADLGPNVDMMALWPDNRHATHLIVCNEQSPSQPGVQRVRLSDGAVETILRGTSSCDPVLRTAWGTIIVGEEAGNSGSVLEIIDPLHTTDVSYDRATHTLTGTDAAHVAYRPAVGHLSFEGIALYPNGVMYYGDENRPGTGTAGGAYFKFVPNHPWSGGAPIVSLAESPLEDGQVYGLRLGKRNGGTDYGQGNNSGLGTWVMITDGFDGDLRTIAATEKLTGFYRPEDADVDGAALAEGRVRFCANNTGNESDNRNWGETICITDGTLEEATANTAVPELQYFAMGTWDFAMMDNIAYQPGRGNWVIHEDGDGPEVGRNNDLWSCLEDGGDVDTLTDGCVRVGTLNDLNAEWTGGFFDASGKRFFVSVQHNVTGHGVILELTGWR